MDITIERVGAVTVVELQGRLDSGGARAVQEQVLPLARADCRVLLDMRGVDYMSSAGLRVLLLIYRQIEDTTGVVYLTGLTARIRDVMDMTGFLDFFTLVDSREEGIETLTNF